MRKHHCSVPSAIIIVLLLTACGTDEPLAPAAASLSVLASDAPTLVETVRRLAAERGVTPLERPVAVRPDLVRLGQLLVFDKELSGNRDIACMTCHMPEFGTGDTRSLSIGQGAEGLGPDRAHPDGLFIPRNAPPLFNVGALESLFWDGRVFADASGRVHTPAGKQVTRSMEAVFEFVSGALGQCQLRRVVQVPVLARGH